MNIYLHKLQAHLKVTFWYFAGTFDNTLLIFGSDHGLPYGDFRRTPQGRLEHKLPLQLLVFPKWFKQEHNSLYDTLKVTRTLLAHSNSFLKSQNTITEKIHHCFASNSKPQCYVQSAALSHIILIDWLNYWLIDWLIELLQWISDQLIGWFIDRSANRPTDWLINWLQWLLWHL